jgi:ABC-2 type transport system permease protein
VASTAQRRGQAGRMNLWRLEWLRLIRTPRAITLMAVFIFFGLVEPVLTRYQSQILAHVGNGVRIVAPPATPAQGMNGYISEITGIGLIVVVVIAAGALSFDARHGLSIFLRTRVTNTWQLVMPRYTVSAAAAAAAYLLGTLAAWYETDLLIGSLPAGAVFAGYLCAAVYLAFAVAVTALAASVVRSTLASTGIALAILLVIQVAGTFRAIHDWLPSTLVSAPVDLLSGAHQLTHYLPAFAVAVAVSAGALAITVRRLAVREI